MGGGGVAGAAMRGAPQLPLLMGHAGQRAPRVGGRARGSGWCPGTTPQVPGRTGKTNVAVQRRNRREIAMRALGYDAHIGRGAKFPGCTGVPPVSSPLCVKCTLKLLKGVTRPRGSSQASGLYVHVFESIA